MVVTEPAVPITRLLGLASKLNPSNMQRMPQKSYAIQALIQAVLSRLSLK